MIHHIVMRRDKDGTFHWQVMDEVYGCVAKGQHTDYMTAAKEAEYAKRLLYEGECPGGLCS